ncbi:MAG: hypothetical protein ACOYBY_13760 [Dermatophilaceae bacterium]
MNHPATRPRLAGALGATWGMALLAAGPRIWAALTGDHPTEADQLAVRALGARHLGQGVFQAVLPTTGQRVLAAVDLLHATSMLALAAGDRTRRRPALVSATVALTNATLLLRWRCERGGAP